MLRWNEETSQVQAAALMRPAVSASEIDLDFTFERPDGKVVKGNYKGAYERVEK